MSIHPGIIGHGHVAVLPLRIMLRHAKKIFKNAVDAQFRPRQLKQPNSWTDQFDSMITGWIILESGMKSANIELIIRIRYSDVSYNSQVRKFNFRKFSANGYRRIKYIITKKLHQKLYRKQDIFDLLNNLEMTALFFAALF